MLNVFKYVVYYFMCGGTAIYMYTILNSGNIFFFLQTNSSNHVVGFAKTWNCSCIIFFDNLVCRSRSRSHHMTVLKERTTQLYSLLYSLLLVHGSTTVGVFNLTILYPTLEKCITCRVRISPKWIDPQDVG